MMWSIPKCAIVGSCNYALILAGDILPTASNYKYLGVIHRETGVDFRTTYDYAVTKQNRYLSTLTNNNWHPKIRLIIYRTFIRPISEYVAPLAHIWANRDLKARSATITAMENAHKTAIKWIFSKRQHLRILDFISGLGPFEYRAECLRAGLARSLSKLSPSNPLLAAKSVYFLSYSKNFILQECFNSTYWKSFQKSNKLKKVTWVTHMKHQFQELQKEASRLSPIIAYYSPSIDTSRISPIFNLPWKDFQLILAWRLNRSLMHRRCTCLASFNRSHLSCVLASNPTYNAVIASTRFKTNSNALALNLKAKNFTPLDHLLNVRMYGDFLYLFNLTQSKLDHKDV